MTRDDKAARLVDVGFPTQSSTMKQATRVAIRTLIDPLPLSLKRFLLSVLKDDPRLNNGIKVEPANEVRVQLLLEEAMRSSVEGDNARAEQVLVEAMAVAPGDPRIPPHLSRVRFLKARADDPETQAANRKMTVEIEAMKAEICRHTIYIPSEFWGTWGRFNDNLLLDYGVENFKRTVSHNYQNWMMVAKDDPQVRTLHEFWSTHQSHQPWLNAMEAPDHVGSPINPGYRSPEYPLADANKREVYRVAVGLLWEYVLSIDTFGVLKGLTELELGNPVRIWRNDRLISSDLAHSVRERNMLLNAVGLNGSEGLTVAELGAGHGRLAEVFGRTTNYRYMIFDITPALYVSQWYIKRIFPYERIFEFRHFEAFSEIKDELKECRFAFFTPNQIELIPDDAFHLFINMNSLMEMRSDQIQNFLAHIDRLTTEAFLSRQWFKWQNPDDGDSLVKEDFALGSRWKAVVDQADDIYPDFFNQIWRRNTLLTPQ